MFSKATQKHALKTLTECPDCHNLIQFHRQVLEAGGALGLKPLCHVRASAKGRCRTINTMNDHVLKFLTADQKAALMGRFINLSSNLALMRLVISCMDRRLNRYLDELNDGDTLFVRNAGANASSLHYTLKLIRDADEVIVLPHTDCGAMGVVHRALSGEKINGVDSLITPFHGLEGSSRHELELENLRVQKEKIKAISGGRVSGEIINTESLQTPSFSDYIAAIMQPSSKKYSAILPEMDGTYVIQVSGSDSDIDISIARKFLGIKKFRYMSGGSLR